MLKRVLCPALAAALLTFCLPAAAQAQELPDFSPIGGRLVSASAFAVYADGRPIPEACPIQTEGVTYVSAAGAIAALRPNATAAWVDGRLTFTDTDFTLTLRTGDPYLVCNGRYLYIPGLVRFDAQSQQLLVPVRVLARALGWSVDWDGSGVYLTVTGAPLESGDTFYNAQDVDLIARVIYHESNNQPFAGQIGVGNVILNRAARPGFGGPTVAGVLAAPNQFPGATSRAPDQEAVIAAKLCLDGANTVGDACWFNGVGKSCWASQHKTLIAVIGNHAFYG